MAPDPSFHTPTVVTILGMAVGVYLIRFAGLFLARRVTPSPTVEAFLGHLPGAMFTALIVPAVVQGGLLYIGAALATLASVKVRAPLVVSLLVGVGTVLAFRSVTHP
ncbi:MAG TPA: AzlD domain-containing protein [Aliidongia sp.]|uniref:AzlD family protein n=1 Tax=Aliidongia sp. TaxID=1914230 RepID=UPI002DDD60FB|nr:AzlD domain-containing protein [Aliidongia sp.]HEV2678583.1 AzlD domain-containing protein [Aliidongia sp.]